MYPPRQGPDKTPAARNVIMVDRTNTMSNIKAIPEYKRMDNIDAMLRGRYTRPSLIDRVRRHVVSRRRG